jgi:UDPglucose 6-dehydrogenase
VGTGEHLRRLISENQAGKFNFGIVSNPEFLREGAAIDDFMRPNRVVIGTRDEAAIAIMRDLYRPLYLIETPVVITSLEAAELTKYASNAFLATKISFINEIANLCDRIGCDVHDVARAMGMDNRIGRYFLHPGPGYGGSCFPKDTTALLSVAREYGADCLIVGAAVEVNEQQRARMVEKIEALLGGVGGREVAVLGLSFKPETDDMREAPSRVLIAALLARGARVVAYDPVAMAEAKRAFASDLRDDAGALGRLSLVDDQMAAVSGSDALVVLTEWKAFKSPDFDAFKRLLKQAVVFDGRNLYDPLALAEAGIEYHSIGRPDATAAAARSKRPGGSVAAYSA